MVAETSQDCQRQLGKPFKPPHVPAAGIHHGTYREGRWWWHSRGYTPAGVECWNGVRGIDYLVSRPDFDPERIGVTGISGGGAATFWIAAADERVNVAVPVSDMADLESYVSNRVINGHCDCMFLYNTFQWPWARIAALIAPRPQLFVNSDEDPIFPMDANERAINRLERVYSLFGQSDPRKARAMSRRSRLVRLRRCGPGWKAQAASCGLLWNALPKTRTRIRGVNFSL